MNNQILVTGGTGFIGSHNSISLPQAGHQVSIMNNRGTNDESVVQRIRQIVTCHSISTVGT